MTTGRCFLLQRMEPLENGSPETLLEYLLPEGIFLLS